MHFLPLRVVEVLHLRFLARHAGGAGGGVLPGWCLHVRAARGREREAGEEQLFQRYQPPKVAVIIRGWNKR